MSLHDTDKNNPRRNKPSLNAPDLNKNPLAHGTTQAQNSIDTPQADGLKIKERQIIAVQDGYNKAAFGFYGAANKFGFKVAQDGKDVLTASDADLIFNSEQNVFKIVATGSYTIPAKTIGSSSSYYIGTSIPHGLGYTPIVDAFASMYGSVFSTPSFVQVPTRVRLPRSNVGGADTSLAYPPYTGSGSMTPWYIDCFADDTNVYISAVFFTNSSGSINLSAIEIKWYCLNESAAA